MSKFNYYRTYINIVNFYEVKFVILNIQKLLFMNKIFLVFTACLFLSCGSSKLIKETEKSFNGEWILKEVTYPDSSGFFDVTLFQTASAACFESSLWKFVANNNRGTVNIYNTDCVTQAHNLVWSVEDSSSTSYAYNVILKMGKDEKASKMKEGSRLQIKKISESLMIWDLNVQFQSQPMIVRLNFERN